MKPTPIPSGHELEHPYDGLDDALKLKLKERIFELISEEGCETFAEIQSHHIENFKGDYTWENRPDLVLWSGLSKEAVIAFTELLVEKKIFLAPRSLSRLCLRWRNAQSSDR